MIATEQSTTAQPQLSARQTKPVRRVFVTHNAKKTPNARINRHVKTTFAKHFPVKARCKRVFMNV